MDQHDRLRNIVEPLHAALTALLGVDRWHPAIGGPALGLIGVAETALFLAVLTLACSAFRTLREDEAGAAMGDAPSRAGGISIVRVAEIGAAFLAAVLLLWSVRTPSADVFASVARWDHLAFAALIGIALCRAPIELRSYALALLSLYFVVRYLGALPIGVTVGGAVIGYAAFRAFQPQGARSTAMIQGFILLVTFAATWWIRHKNLLEGLQASGAFGFVLLRHISFVVDARQRRDTSLGRYLCYMSFYPCFIGSSELYGEFSDRNFVRTPFFPYRYATLKIIAGQLQLWAGSQIDTSFDKVIQIDHPVSLWVNMIILFIRSGLFVMGWWTTVEGVAFLYGITLRPNFVDVLTRENPAQFWRSWRATLMNWLVRYVYIPLGGNRNRQIRNIYAAFAVSTAWHWLGVPFFTPHPTPWDFMPVALWGIVDATGVAGYIAVRRRGITILPGETPHFARRATKIALTACFAACTAALLTFTPQYIDRFAPFIRTLLGIR